jgi:hypothetical protein
MAITIDSTVGGASANSYVSKAELDSYLDTRLHNSAVVTAATDDTKNRAIATATRLLDELIEWEGEPADAETQVLQWPRLYLYDTLGNDLDGDAIPQQIKTATMELAVYLVDSDRTSEQAMDGLSNIEVGPIKIGLNTSNPQKRKPIPDAVFQMVSQWGKLKFKTSGSIPLERA